MDFNRIFDIKDQSKDEEKIASGVKTLLSKSIKAKEADPEVEKWDEYETYYNLNFMEEEDDGIEDWKSRIYINEAHKEIETLKPFILDNEPRLTVKPLNNPSVNKTELVKKILEHICASNDTDYETVKEMSAHNCYVLGTAITAVNFSYEKCYTGEVIFRCVDPRNFFPDPTAANISDSRYVIEKAFIDVEMLINSFPEKKSKILSLVDKDEVSQVPRSLQKKLTDSSRLTSATDSIIMSGKGFDEPEDENRFNDLEVYFCYIRDNSDEKIKVEKDETGKEYEVRKRKYGRQGRLIVSVGEVVLYDGLNPYPVIPYAKTCDFQKAKSNKNPAFWGIGEIALIHSVCKEITKAARRSLDLMKQHSYPRIRISPDAEIEEEEITNAPDDIIRANVNEFELIAPPAGLTNEHLSIKAILENDCEKTTGQNKAVQGAEPGSAKSGVAIQSLQFMGTKKNKLKAQKFYKFLAEMGRIAVAIAAKMYPKNKIIQVAKKNDLSQDQGVFEFLTLNITNEEDPSGEIVHNNIRDLEFDMVAKVDEGIFTTREQRRSEALEYHQAGVFTPEALLYYVDMPEANKIIESLRQQQQAQAELAAASGGQQPNLGGQNFGTMASGTNLIQRTRNNT